MHIFYLLAALALLLIATPPAIYAQDCYTTPAYEVWVEKDVPYGQATNYCGQNQSLLMDIYRPIGDGNPMRPAVVLIHGGAFLGGDKGSYDMVEAARAFAARGYLAVSINYRLGFHKSVFYAEQATGCALFGILAGVQYPQCLYAYDKEIMRALYRGMQDARGAIRYVKNQIDSVSVQNVFAGGSSAGGFIALAAAYMGEEEAPEEAGAQAAVFGGIPFIYWGCHPTGASCSLERPALGPPEGALNLGGHDASVKGVLNIFGGLLGLDWIDEGEPMLYAYHQDNDLVSPCSSGKPFAALLSRCASGACPSIPNTWPQSFGSCAMQDYLAALPGAPAHEIWIDECPAPSFPCSYSCHEAAAGKVQQIVQGAAEFWGCMITGQQEPPAGLRLTAFPNPARGWINFKPYPPGYPFEIILYDMMGRVGARIQAPGETSIDISHFPAGLYLLKWRSGRQEGAQRLLIHE